MSGHDPALLVVPPLQRKERRPEERGGSATCGKRKRDAERERERERPLVSHSTRSKTRYKTRCNAASAATKSESRMSIVPAHLAEKLRLSTASAWHHRLLSLSLFFALSLSFSRQRTPRRSVNQVENPQELVLNPRWSFGKARSGSARSNNKNVITAYAIAIYVKKIAVARSINLPETINF